MPLPRTVGRSTELGVLDARVSGGLKKLVLRHTRQVDQVTEIKALPVYRHEDVFEHARYMLVEVFHRHDTGRVKWSVFGCEVL